MANLREALAGTAFASLEWSPDWERAVDRVAASGRATRLGLALWKARYLLEISSYREARTRLIERYARRFRRMPSQTRERVIEQCLREYIAPFCMTCKGAKEIVIEQKRIICYECSGSGVRRYTDSDRANAMGISFAEAVRLGKQCRIVLDDIATHDQEVGAVLTEQLERLTTRFADLSSS